MKILFIIILSVLFIKAAHTQTFNTEKFCEEIVDLYKTEEVAAKKERLVYKKINELIGTSKTFKFICSDSIVYDKKEDKSVVKSRESFYADAKTGYFGIFFIVSKNTDELLMKTTPDKELSISGKIIDIVVIGFNKDGLNKKTYTPLKDFEDGGTIITQVIFKVDS